jgi:hypothetical protein
MPCRRATSMTTAPGTAISARVARFSARLQIRLDDNAVNAALVVCPDAGTNLSPRLTKPGHIKLEKRFRARRPWPDGYKFAVECGFEDEGFFTSLLRMFDQALIAVMTLPPTHRQPLLERLDRVRSIAKAVGWGVKDAMDDLWAERVVSD